jgi:uncharacterized protein (DUF3820 family)
MKVTQKPRARQGPPGKVVLRFGKHKGRVLEELPVDYVAALRQFDGLFAETRKQIESYLRQLVRDPGQTKMPFGGHAGEQLDELETSYLDWLVGEVDLGPALGWLVKAELRRRESSIPTYDGTDEQVELVATDDEGNSYAFKYTRPKVVGHVKKLPEIEDWIPFDTRGFIPSESLGGGDRRPSLWSQRRPREQVQAEDEAVNQVWNHVKGQLLLWPEGLGLPPMQVLHNRKDRKRTYWSVVNGEPTIRGQDAHTDVSRLLAWDTALEALDRMAGADDLGDLEDRYAEAVHLVRLLAQEENWDQDSNSMLDEVAQAYEARKESLERREVTFTDAPHRVEPSAKQKAWYAGDLEVAKVHEVVRRMRGCRTDDELLDEAAWVRRHRDEFDEEALAHLRRWFTYFKAQLHLQQ